MAGRKQPGGGEAGQRGLFELGGYWIDTRTDRPGLHRFWYDARAGEIRRRSLGTSDLEAAKLKLAAIVGGGKTKGPRDPEKVLLAAVLYHYFETHSDKLPSADQARHAGRLLLEFLLGEAGFKADVKVSTFTMGMQQAFAEWCVSEYDHSVGYISRNLSVIAAAFEHGTKEIVCKTPDGELREVRLLNTAPQVSSDKSWISRAVDKPKGGPREYVPTYEVLASLLDAPGSEALQRYDIMALNTWARPEAILDLRVTKQQVDFDHDLVHLNPPGRRQTKKRRPTIRLTRNLRGWLEEWKAEAPLRRPVLNEKGRIVDWEPVGNLKNQFKRRTFFWMLTQIGLTEEQIKDLERDARNGRPERFWKEIERAEAAGIRRITQVTLRHFMATRVRGLKEIKVEREQREIWLGHVEGDTTEWYEHFDPEYLRACAEGTDLVLAKLDALTRRPLLPASLRERAAPALKIVE